MPFWWLHMYGINLILQHIDTVFIQCLIISYCNLMSLGLTCLIQAGSLFPVTSPCSAILLSNMIFNGLKYFHGKDINNHQVQDRRWLNIRSCIRCTETLWGQVGFVVILYGLFTVLNPNEDASHILQFILHKFHLSDKWDFDTALYLCSQSFQHMDLEQYMMEIIGSKWILPSYAFGLVVLIKEMLSHYIGHKRIANNRFIRLYKKLSTEITQKSYTNLHEFRKKNEIHSLSRIQAWHLAYSFSFGFLAWSTVRMKYLWTPHMLMLAVFGVKQFLFISLNILFHFSRVICKFIMGKSSKLINRSEKNCHQQTSIDYDRYDDNETKINIIGTAILILIAVMTSYQAVHQITYQLNQLGEFYDPDTVELMEWIKNNVNKESIFTGSMQLMAGVKCCTSRPIANHPHYENAELRRRTKQLYQIYGRKSTDDVYSILRNYSINYFIIETSICFAKSTGCHETDLIDLENKERYIQRDYEFKNQLT
ncbi:unnamed protein product [Heterobilharzia americana]|nr:unnamed protein product [Heterobilharzia americana]